MYEISTNLFKMYEYPMYCKMLGVGNSAILKKKNVCKSLVEPISAILVRFSIFSIHQRLIVHTRTYLLYVLSTVRIYCTRTVQVLLIPPELKHEFEGESNEFLYTVENPIGYSYIFIRFVQISYILTRFVWVSDVL